MIELEKAAANLAEFGYQNLYKAFYDIHFARAGKVASAGKPAEEVPHTQNSI